MTRFFNNMTWLAALIAVLSLQSVGSNSLQAQEASGPILPRFPIQPIEEPAVAPNVVDDRVQPQRADSDYWIVSTRHCPQSGMPNCTPEQYQYFHVTADGHRTLSSLAEYKRQIDPNVPICIVVHGSYSTWRSLLADSKPVNRWLRSAAPASPLQVVFYTWPSEPITAVLPAVDVGILGRRASYNGFYLSQLIQQTPDNSRISFFAHSHGARVVSASLQLLDGGALNGYQLRQPGRGNRTMRPIFAAAAIDHHWLNPGERFGRAMNQIDQGLVLYNERDIALMLYPLRRLFSHRPLGLVGFDRTDRRLQNGRARKLTEVDVTPQVDTGHLWENYIAKRTIAAAMRPYLFFEEVQRQQCPNCDTGLSRSPQRNPRRYQAMYPQRRVIRESSSETNCIHIPRSRDTIHK